MTDIKKDEKHEQKIYDEINTHETGDRIEDCHEAVSEKTSKRSNSEGISEDGKSIKKTAIVTGSFNDPKYIPVEMESEEVDISGYVSNTDKNVYAITNLPEEFIATLFAWVSRSPKSFREHLKEAAIEFQLPKPMMGFGGLNKKAKDFHEKWTVGYGHSSVAEHAIAHVGIENISRLASAELELSNTFLSITEYSQRYQKPERGQWYNPFTDAHVDLQESVECFYNKAFDVFEELIIGVHAYLCDKENIIPVPGAGELKVITQRRNELMKLAFEDARYVLPLAMYTQLGMTANGRAWRDALSVLGNSDHAESQTLANDLKEEITKVLPVLLKHADPSQYQRNSKKRMKNLFDLKNTTFIPEKKIQLYAVEEEEKVMNKIISLLQQQTEDIPFRNALYLLEKYTDRSIKEQIIKDLLHEMQFFDAAPDVFKHVHYHASVLVSEANWHQLLRHNRRTAFTFSNPSANFGITIPPRIHEAGLAHLVKDIAQQSQELYNGLMEEGFEKEAEYVVLNLHRRQVNMTFDLQEAYHLINLRTSEEAQWDIRETFESLYKQLETVHPLLMSQAKRRV